MSTPLVSVIIPTYNYANYIMDAVNSVLSQNYPSEKIEIIIVDDGSTDGTIGVLQPFIEKKLLSYYYQENKGKASATFFAIQRCSGKYIFNLDADDWFLPDKISASVKIFKDDDSIVHVATPAKIYTEENKTWQVETLPKEILQQVLNGSLLLCRFNTDNILFGGGSTFGARSEILKLISIPEAVDMYIDEFLILALLPFGKSFFINEPLSVWRVHHNNYSVGMATKEIQLAKGNRLLSSSSAVLNYLLNNNFDRELVKIYKVKDATRKIAFKESCNSKTIHDIGKYFLEIVLLKPNWQIIKSYSIINRLLPTLLLSSLKGIIKRFKV